MLEIVSDPKVDFLRHTLATLAYRGGKAVRGAPDDFGSFRIGSTSRTPVQVLAHVGDLLEWATWLLRGQHRWRDTEPLVWSREIGRFHGTLLELDRELLIATPSAWTLEQLFQGPIADALTHIGQIAMLRRLAGCPIRGENYTRAEIVLGRLGEVQAAPRVEFD